MFGLGTWEILMILIVALVFIGPSKLPSLARTMGKGMRDVRRAMAGFEDEVRQASSIPEPDLPDEAEADEMTVAPPSESVPQSDAKSANAPPQHAPTEEASEGIEGETHHE